MKRLRQFSVILAIVILASVGRSASAESTGFIPTSMAAWNFSSFWTNGLPRAGVDTYIGSGGTAYHNSGDVTMRNLIVAPGGIFGDGGALGTFGKFNANNISVGSNLGTGTATLQGGSKVAAQQTEIGTSANFAVSTATVRGANSSWNSGSMYVTGNGELSVESGGSVESFTGSVDGAVVTAKATVTGAGSMWKNTSALAIGSFYQGWLVIENGGVVESAGARLGDDQIGQTPASYGLATVTGTGSAWKNSGALTVGGDGFGVIEVSNGGLLTSNGAATFAAVHPNPASAIWIKGAGSKWQNTGDISIAGGLLVTGGGEVVCSGSALTSGAGYIAIDSGSALRARAISSANLSWDGGTLQFDEVHGNLDNSKGICAPRFSPVTSVIYGNYVQGSEGSLAIDIGGTTPNVGYDLLNVTGTATIDGLLNLALQSGFTPSAVDVFTVFSAGFLLGAFENIASGQRLATTDGRGSFVVNYGPTSAFNPNIIRLTNFQATPLFAADFDEDGNVDGDDLTRWRAGYGTGSLHTQGDADGDVDVDGADFLVWQREVGQPSVVSASFGAGAAVPEPSACSMMLSMGVAALALKRRSSGA